LRDEATEAEINEPRETCTMVNPRRRKYTMQIIMEQGGGNQLEERNDILIELIRRLSILMKGNKLLWRKSRHRKRKGYLYCH
jgi:hypothetical protein